MELTLALGQPLLAPQSPVAVSGFKPAINAVNWLTVRVTHHMDGMGGYTTRAELENADAGKDEGATETDDNT